MIKKGLAVAVILLFIGVAFAPSINAKMNNEPIPDLDCEGDIYWIGEDLEPGDVLTGDFTVGNIGEPLSELDWRIMSCPFWGTWTFDPESGTGLTPEDGFLTVAVEFILAVEINETLYGEIGIQNVDNESDICYIDIQIKKKSDDDLVEIEVEFSGLGKKHTVKLTQTEADEVEKLFDDIEQRLSEVETREEAEEIFKDAVFELDKYGLLGEMSVRQVQRLVIDNMQQSPLFNQKEYVTNENDTNNSNLMCLIAGKTSETFITGILGRIGLNLIIPLAFLSAIIESLPDSILRIVLEGMLFLCLDFVFIYLVFVSLIDFIPVSIGDVIMYDNSQGWVLTFGLYGLKNWNGIINGNIESIILDSIGVFGFRGIHVYTRPSEMKAFYLGQANYVNIETV